MCIERVSFCVRKFTRIIGIIMFRKFIEPYVQVCRNIWWLKFLLKQNKSLSEPNGELANVFRTWRFLDAMCLVISIDDWRESPDWINRNRSLGTIRWISEHVSCVCVSNIARNTLRTTPSVTYGNACAGIKI